MELYLPDLTSTMQIIGCHFGTKPPGWRYARHHHFLFEILHCMEGSAYQMIGDDETTLHAGEWMLFKSGVAHEMMNLADQPYRYFNVHFDLDDPILRAALCQFDYTILTPEEIGASMDQQLAIVEGTILSLTQNTGNKLSGSIQQLHIQAFILELIERFSQKIQAQLSASVGESAARPTSYTPTSSETAIAREMEYILRMEQPYKGTIGDIASELGLSRSQCSKIFTKVYGQSPRQYISRLILNKAKHLLVNSNLSIEQIAEELGFESTSQFSRQFRRWTGTAPSHFRPRLHNSVTVASQ
ncbi:helix-turn-helix domain-containing protein [Paenibacillus terrigena]|uniref:helix-turn-helix domain-containing protein n=1 Tax=Paenibacillus terrigena TaxID=369333 RepID=UPI00036F76C2|nr:AraC family transcriptional regulator [Paenibacillus terrigena]